MKKSKAITLWLEFGFQAYHTCKIILMAVILLADFKEGWTLYLNWEAQNKNAVNSSSHLFGQPAWDMFSVDNSKKEIPQVQTKIPS